jgi:hypothetical protein
MTHPSSTPAKLLRVARCLLVCAGLTAAAAGPVAAGPPLPQRNLAVEARIIDSSVLERQTLGGGSVTVGTGGSTQTAGGVAVRAGTDTQRGDSVQRVLVLNGGRATIRLSQWLPLRSTEWVWAGAGRGAGGGTVWVDIGQGLAVRPSWPGGNQPARAEVAVESAGRNDRRSTPGAADASAPRLAVSTELSMPLGEWVSVAQMFDDSSSTAGGVGIGGGSSGVVTSTRSLRRELNVQLRVTAP